MVGHRCNAGVRPYVLGCLYHVYYGIPQFGIKYPLKNLVISITFRIFVGVNQIVTNNIKRLPNDFKGQSNNDLLRNTAQIVHSRHRSVGDFIMNLISALGAYCFFENKPKALQEKSMRG